MNIAIILAGGIGVRVGANIPKQFIEVLGKPIMVYTLETFQKNKMIDEIVLVCVASHIELAKQYCEKYKISKAKTFVVGGKEFVDSCINGVNSLYGRAKENDILLITSADRPLISDEEIEDSINVCKKYGCGIAAKPCSLCMFKVGEDRSHSNEYLRQDLMQTATPWTFEYTRLKESLEKYINKELPQCETYPIAIYAAAGNDIYFSKAKPENIKITEKYDVLLLEHILKNKNGGNGNE